MTVHQFIAIGLSLGAIIISLHTKYKQREKERLRELANKLKNIRKYTESVEDLLYNPRSHEDLDLRLTEIPREMLACQYETESDVVTIFPSARTGYGEDDKEITEAEELFDRYKNQDRFRIELKIGNRDELYVADRRFHITDPFQRTSYLYEELSEIEDQFGETVDEFDDSLFPELESHLDSIVRKHCNHIISISDGASVDVGNYDSTDEIGADVFRILYFYDGIEEDLGELEEIIDNLESLRTTVLQTSYS